MTDQDALKRGVKEIDFVLHRAWRLGRMIVAGWHGQGERAQFCLAPPDRVLTLGNDHPRLFNGRRFMGPSTFNHTCKVLGVRPTTIDLPFTVGTRKGDVDYRVVERIVRRYGVVQTRHRAVMLFDIVGFSKRRTTDQVAQLLSLENAINGAAKLMYDISQPVELARSTVGDGFYVWNRDKGYAADLRTFIVLLLILADNARARKTGGEDVVPLLRSCFCVGSHFSYHQVEGWVPRGFEYIVGDVTISLARLIAHADTGQIVIGEIHRPTQSVQAGDLDSVSFVARAEKLAQGLVGQEVGGGVLKGLRAYLSAIRSEDPTKTKPALFIAKDKHGFEHRCHNLRADFALESGETVALGRGVTELPQFARMLAQAG